MSSVNKIIKATKEENIVIEAEKFVNEYTGGSKSYHNNITIHHDIICDNYNEAFDKVIELRFDSPSGKGDHAVRYYSTKQLESSSALQELNNKIKNLRKKAKEIIAKNHVGMRKAKLITCSICESKVSRNYFGRTNEDGSFHSYTDSCPACHNDMKTKAVREKIFEINDELEILEEKRDELKMSLTVKSEDNLEWIASVSTSR